MTSDRLLESSLIVDNIIEKSTRKCHNTISMLKYRLQY